MINEMDDDEELPPPFYDCESEYAMENKKGRPSKYLTLKEWTKWRTNDWHHAELRSKISFGLIVTMWIAIVGKLVLDFFFLA